MSLQESLTKENFKKWLESKETDEVIGQAAMCKTCPIAQFLVESGFPSAYVGMSTLSTEGEFVVDGNHPLPTWAERFIELVDGEWGSDNPESRQEVYAGRALVLL